MTEQLTENSELTTEQIVEKEDAEDLSFYLGTVFMPQEAEHVSQEARRIAVETILLLHSVELTALPGSSEPRDITIRAVHDANAGLPKSKGEATALIKGPTEKFKAAGLLKKGHSVGATKSTYKSMDSYREDALRDMAKLNKVMGSESDFDMNLLRANREAQHVIAEYLMAREFLDKMKWPAKTTHEYRGKRKYWRGCVLEASRYAGSSVLGLVARDVRHDTRERMSYWTDHVREIAMTTAGTAVRGALAAETKMVESDDIQEFRINPSEIPVIVREEPDLRLGAENSFESIMPAPEFEHMTARRDAYRARIDDLQHKGMPEAEKQAILEREFPEFTDTPVLDYQEVRRQAIERSKLPPSSGRPRRRAYSGRGGDKDMPESERLLVDGKAPDE